jgi:hypothetical protein
MTARSEGEVTSVQVGMRTPNSPESGVVRLLHDDAKSVGVIKPEFEGAPDAKRES